MTDTAITGTTDISYSLDVDHTSAGAATEKVMITGPDTNTKTYTIPSGYRAIGEATITLTITKV
jgi:hypothetical protein